MDDISIGYISIFAVIVGIGLIIGFSRGFKRSFYRLLLVIIALLVTIGTLPMILDAVMTYDFSSLYVFELDGQKAESAEKILALLVDKYAGEYFPADSATAGLALTFAKMAASLVVFFIWFGIISFVFLLVYWLTKGLVAGKSTQGKKYKNKKLLGGLVGAVNGVLIAFIALSPLLGMADFASAYTSNPTIRGYIPGDVIEYIDDFTGYDGFIKKIFGFKNIDIKFFDRLTTVKNDDGSELSLSSFKEFSAIIEDAAWFVDNKDLINNLEALTNEQLEEAITHARSIIDFLFKNGITEIIINDGVAYVNNNPDRIINLVPEGQLRPLVAEVIDALFGDGKPETVKKELDAIFDFVSEAKDDVKYFIANGSKIGALLSSTDVSAEKTAFVAHAKSIVSKLFIKEDGVSANDSLLSTVAVKYLKEADIGALLGSNATLASLTEAVTGAVFYEGQEDIDVMKVDLNAVLMFAFDVIESPMMGAFGSASSLDGFAAIEGIFGASEFVTLMNEHLYQPAVLKVMNGILETFVTDDAMLLPISEYFEYLHNNPGFISAEIGYLASAAADIGSVIEAAEGGELSSLGAALGGFADQLLDASGKSTITGRTIIAIMSNMMGSMTGSTSDPIGIAQKPTVETSAPAWSGTDWTSDDWDSEALLIKDVLIGQLLAQMETLSSAPQPTLTELVAFGKVLDDFKGSIAFYNVYGSFIDAVIDSTGFGTAFESIEQIPADSYRDVQWEASFNIAYIAAVIGGAKLDTGTTELFTYIDLFIDGNDFNSSYNLVFNNILTSAGVGTEAIAAAQALVSGGGTDVPDVVADYIGALLSDKDLSDDWASEWVDGFINYLASK
ncbi:MAG: hypothetical protein LBQ27_04990 [Clostridiales bacterium]|jgi:hypothetical protein|nr:hypothetical protein [Clostridiales bacterium]